MKGILQFVMIVGCVLTGGVGLVMVAFQLVKGVDQATAMVPPPVAYAYQESVWRVIPEGEILIPSGQGESNGFAQAVLVVPVEAELVRLSELEVIEPPKVGDYLWRNEQGKWHHLRRSSTAETQPH